MTGAMVCGSGMLQAGLVGGRRAAFLVQAWGAGSVSVSCAGPAAVALLRVGWLNVRSPVLLDLYLRFCILAVSCLYLRAAIYGIIKNNNNNTYIHLTALCPG